MIARALLVWLLVMNLGVLAWWATHRADAPVDPPRPSQAIPQLEAVADGSIEVAVGAAVASSAATPAPPASAALAPAAEDPAPVCASFGPFDDETAAAVARSRLAASEQVRVRRVGGASARGYNVFLPPLPDRVAAQAMAARLRAAGFDDLVVIGQGADANGIALGRFGSEANAQKHQAALQAQGFAAQIAPAGGEPARYWLDVRAAAGFDAAAMRSRIGAREVQARDC